MSGESIEPSPAVLNGNDRPRGAAVAMLAAMSSPSPPSGPSCPAPWTRAPRAAGPAANTHGRLHLAPLVLQGAVVCVICRDTRHVPLCDAQRLTHLPATPFVCLSLFQHSEVG